MAFPQTPLPITVELYLNSTWTNITSDVYERDAITITRGRSDEGGQVDPGRCLMTLDNRTGKYSPRNTASPYYGQLGRNTPIRVSVDAGDPSLQLPGSTGSGASTPDTAVLDLTGDMEIQIEISHDTWDFSTARVLMGKWLMSGDQRSYALTIGTDNTLTFRRTTLGTLASQQTDISTEAVPIPVNGRVAIKVTFDLDDGTGVSRTKFYTSDSIDGTWTQLGSDETGSTTATYSGTANLLVGDSDGAFDSWDGNIHEFRLLSSIGGSAVANPDFTAQAVGATSFTDAAGRTWTITGSAAINNRDRRFYGEVSSWPVQWSTSSNDVYVKLEAAGILRRLGQGAAPLQSTIRRAIPQSVSELAYWPMEDGASARQFNSPMSGVQPMTFRSFDPASIDTMPGSSPLPTISSSSNTTIRLNALVPSNNSGEARVEFVYRTDTAPTTLRTYMRIMTTGTIREWQLQMNDTQARMIGRDSDGTAVFTNDLTWGATEPFGAWWRFAFTLIQNGSDVDYTLAWYRDGETTLTDSGTATSRTFGRVYALMSPTGGFSTDLDGTGIGHIAVFSSVTVGDDFTDADMGYDGEIAGTRLERLRDEEDIALILHGSLDDQEALGPQRPNSLLALLQECADADGGILYEGRRALTLEYRDRSTLYNQDARLTLNCQGNEGLASPLDPVDDDQHVRNDITVARTDGSEGTAVLSTGSLSVQNPPNGVGRYKDSLTLNLYDDDQAIQAANWFLHLGTWDETRYPRVSVLLQKSSTAKVAQAMAVEIGDRIQLTNPQSWLPPGTIDLLVQGYTELIHQFRWEFEFNCTPARPWNVAYADDSFSRAAATTSDLVTAIDSDDTSLTVSSEPRWLTSTAYASEFPFTVEMGVETMSATAITSAQLDAFGRTTASGWGSADIGGSWSTSGGSASDYAVGSGYGSHTQSTVNIQRRAVLTSPSADFDIYVDITTSATATGASLNGGPIARSADGSNFYTARLEFTTANAIVLTLRKRVAGSETQLATFTSTLTHVAGTFVRVRFQGTGTALKAKVWLATGVEPGVWHVEATDSELTTASSSGVRSFATTGNTNVNPQVRFDNFEMINPQTFTVTRSSNGVVKSHSAGADIQLRDTVAVAF